MTTIDYAARVSHARPSMTSAFVALFQAPGLFLKRRFVAAQTRSELYALTDRQLDDIGVERAQIQSISTDMAARVYA